MKATRRHLLDNMIDRGQQNEFRALIGICKHLPRSEPLGPGALISNPVSKNIPPPKKTRYRSARATCSPLLAQLLKLTNCQRAKKPLQWTNAKKM